MENMRVLILGGGLAGISLAYFLQDRPDITAIEILEKEDRAGGLCRSFEHKGIAGGGGATGAIGGTAAPTAPAAPGVAVDIGPHILFSKDKETLGLMLDLLGDNKHELRRSNRIIYKGTFVQYPFENDLSKLPPEDCARCLKGFLDNPYRDYPADNMLRFFLKTFGEGITNLYLRPYNEKIWKFDPAFMDTQMVERIPRPPDEDIKRSAAGETVDGYTHQLFFSYPMRGGIESLVYAFTDRFNQKVKLHTSCEVSSVERHSGGSGGWRVASKSGAASGAARGETFESDILISTIPVNILTEIYGGIDSKIAAQGKDLRYNNIVIAIATVKTDRAGDNFAFMLADRDVIFHRLSKIDFLGENYHKQGTATYMMEYTYRDGDPVAMLQDGELQKLFAEGLQKIGFIGSADEIEAFTMKRFPYAYVIYDLHHKQNMTAIREYFGSQGVYLNGRFGNFEYWNMDKVIAESRELALRL